MMSTMDFLKMAGTVVLLVVASLWVMLLVTDWLTQPEEPRWRVIYQSPNYGDGEECRSVLMTKAGALGYMRIFEDAVRIENHKTGERIRRQDVPQPT